MSAIDSNVMIDHVGTRIKQETIDIINYARVDLKGWLRGLEY